MGHISTVRRSGGAGCCFFFAAIYAAGLSEASKLAAGAGVAALAVLPVLVLGANTPDEFKLVTTLSTKALTAATFAAGTFSPTLAAIARLFITIAFLVAPDACTAASIPRTAWRMLGKF